MVQNFIARVSLLICFLMSSNCTVSSSSALSSSQNFEIKSVLTGNLGEGNGEFGGYTQKELNKKEDPFAYSSAAFPQDFARDAAGNIIVADGKNHRIQKFSSEGKFLFSLDTCGDVKLEWPYRVTVNKSGGTIILGEEINGNVCIYSHEGTFFKRIEGRKIDLNLNAEKMAVNSKGDIYIYNVGKVYVFSKNGEFLDSRKTNNFIIDNNDRFWSLSPSNDDVSTFKISPKGKWRDMELVGIDGKNNFYVKVADDRNAYLLMTDIYGNERIRISAIHEGYYIDRWQISFDGTIYAMGINSDDKQNFVKIFQIQLKRD